MTDFAVNDALSEAHEQHPQCRNLKPWPKGVSGNPGGRLQNGKRYQQLHGRLKAELGGMTAIEEALLDKAVTLLLRRPKNDSDAVKLASEARRILERLRADCEKAKPAFTPLRERLAAEAEDAA